MVVSECLVQDHNSVTIHADDSNISDHYAISCSIDTGNQSNVSATKDVKIMWDKADLNLHRLVLQEHLSQIILPVDALLCVCDTVCRHDLLIDKYYQEVPHEVPH